MSGANALVGLIGSYDSGSDSEPENEAQRGTASSAADAAAQREEYSHSSAVTHPSPISHCPWSACYDEGTGYTYYWNQNTNEVTWEAPPEYLLALKVASQKLSSSVQSEVTAEEWMLYQQALLEKQKFPAASAQKPATITHQTANNQQIKGKSGEDANSIKDNQRKRSACSESEDEKIELITSYYHSDSDSNDETDIPYKLQIKSLPQVNTAVPVSKPVPATTISKKVHKKQKVKVAVEYGPTLPSDVEYSVPIGPELPPALVQETKENCCDIKVTSEVTTQPNIPAATEILEETSNGLSTPTNRDSQDEENLMQELLNKAKILENLGGELPRDVKKLIKPSTDSSISSPQAEPTSDSTLDTNIDDLLEEIEKRELPKVKPKKIVEKIDMFSENNDLPSNGSENLPPRTDVKDAEPVKEPLFPTSKDIVTETVATPDNTVPTATCLFPSAVNVTSFIQSPEILTANDKVEILSNIALEKKGENIYIMPSSEAEIIPKKKMRISRNVLPVKKSEVPSYTTKYSQYIDGFSSERTGLGFSHNDYDSDTNKKSAVQGNYMNFTKGETLNEEKKQEEILDESLADLLDLISAKLRFLNQQALAISPVQEMTIQLQTLNAAHIVGALSRSYWKNWLQAAASSLHNLETSAAPVGWTCHFNREEGRYAYRCERDGREQWEYPAPPPPPEPQDMDISTTPPCSPHKDTVLERSPPPPPPPPPPASEPPPPPPSWTMPQPPPPPAWSRDGGSPLPPPPGCEDDLPALPDPTDKQEANTKNESLGDELLSFYSDIAKLETTIQPEPSVSVTASVAPVVSATSVTQPVSLPSSVALAVNMPSAQASTPARVKVREDKEPLDTNGTAKPAKKKMKQVKISGSVGMKQKNVSSMVAKWQQVQEQIDTD